MSMLTYREAINQALLQEMERDSSVFCFGPDVDDHKRIYGSTQGLVEKFGSERCFSTPISEDALTGMALGAAISGMRPVQIHIRVDFLLLGMNQLCNMISTARYMSGGALSVPLVVRAVVGRGWGQSAQHSKSLHGTFGHIPGLKVVMPTTPEDAKGLLISAIRDENPVVFLEHRWLYDTSGEVNGVQDGIPLGKASVVREGSDITLVATSWMVVEALQAASILEQVGVSVEVIDPRCAAPLDMETIVASVNRTGRCIVADNDWSFCGLSAEISAQVSEQCFSALQRPVNRVGWAHAPCPTTRCLENQFYPDAQDLIREVEQQLDLSPTNLEGIDFYTYENRFKGPF